MDNLIKILSNRAGDSSFEDFGKSIYKDVLLIGRRKVARRYELIERLYKFEATTTSKKIDNGIRAIDDVILPIPSFDSEYKVLVNDKQFNKVNMLTNNSKNEYVLWRNQSQILFNFYPRSTKDDIKIYYKSDINKDDYDVEELAPVIPSKYNEEVITFALIELAKRGIVKFHNSGKEKKYTNLLQLYNKDERSLDKTLMRNNAWTSVKVYHVV